MAYTTIRKNSLKRIESLLKSMVLIREVYIDDMGDRNQSVTPEQVMNTIKEFEANRVYLDDSGNITISIHGNWFFHGYISKESAIGRLTPQAIAKYFPETIQPGTSNESQMVN